MFQVMCMCVSDDEHFVFLGMRNGCVIPMIVDFCGLTEGTSEQTEIPSENFDPLTIFHNPDGSHSNRHHPYNMYAEITVCVSPFMYSTRTCVLCMHARTSCIFHLRRELCVNASCVSATHEMTVTRSDEEFPLLPISSLGAMRATASMRLQTVHTHLGTDPIPLLICGGDDHFLYIYNIKYVDALQLCECIHSYTQLSVYTHAFHTDAHTCVDIAESVRIY